MTGGYWMLAAVGALMLLTGAPAAFVLLAVACLAAAVGAASGLADPSLLPALPGRIVGLLDSDLLQALPLYVLMGALLNRLPLASTLFRAFSTLFPRGAAAPRSAALALGAMLGPMNGSVGGSVATLSRAVYPPLRAAGTPAPTAAALVCVASTLGVVVPPSLVLILLGDAAMRAHTEALNVTHAEQQIINTQNVFRGALVPAALLLVALLAMVWITSARRDEPAPPRPQLALRERVVAAATFAVIAGLLGGVAWGALYAVEAAATGALVLFVAAACARQLTLPLLREVLRDTLSISGAVFALFVAATTFTLVFRAFGTDRHLAAWIVALPGGPTSVLAAVLGMVALCALVLDAFEIIFVIVPLVMPPLLVRVADATWVSVLLLLTLQASFLVPPFGYAVMMTAGSIRERIGVRALAKALAPYIGVQWLVVAAVFAFPALTQLTQGDTALHRLAAPGEGPRDASTGRREDPGGELPHIEVPPNEDEAPASDEPHGNDDPPRSDDPHVDDEPPGSNGPHANDHPHAGEQPGAAPPRGTL